ncbi:DUF1376 domain-containing protein [Cupriavidus sp. amp6]|uniref:DUF1376 domain-containing protein n=1 Tax=Cupriavidus sp. amp6 TaxID=388051 RepID=UPI000412FDEF|nr:DUF1376 domain-containing protein [Cupriavidus sp. amp6]
MNDLPEPLTPVDCDLRDFQFMPLDVERLRDSDLAALEAPEACWAAVLLWCAAWHQLPAASLPDDDRILSQLAGFGRVVKEWQKVRDGALRGWIKCKDGRLYHPVVAEKAHEAWRSKLKQRWDTEKARVKKYNQRNGTSLIVPDFDEWLSRGRGKDVPGDIGTKSPRTKPPCPSNVPREMASKGQGEGQGYINHSSGITTDGGCACAAESPLAAALVEALGRHGIPAHAADARLQRWAGEGATPVQLEHAIGVGRERRQRERSVQPLNVGFIDVLLADILAARGASPTVTAGPPAEWHTSASGITAHGATLGVFQGADEPFPYFKARVFEAAGDGPWVWKQRGAVTIAGGTPVVASAQN